MNYYHFSEIGQRETNEDVTYCHCSKEQSIFMVADGMGGYQFGELAARLAIESLSEFFLNHYEVNEEMIINAFHTAHNLIKLKLDNAGTTIGGILILQDTAHVFWAGDVRIILKNNAKFYSTKDHSLYNFLRDENIFIKSDEIERLKNTVVRSLGGKSNSYIPEILTLKIGSDFSAIICSDGVHRFLDIDFLYQILQNSAYDSVLDILKKNGEKGSDNYSAVYIEKKILSEHRN